MPAGALKLDGSGRRILVVDDDLAIRVLLQAVLKRMNFDVDLAEDGMAGLRKLDEEPAYDLILLDLMMPKVNGYEFIDKVNAAYNGKHPHMIVFTAAGQRGVEKIKSGTICSSILKPFDLETFLDLISRCILNEH